MCGLMESILDLELDDLDFGFSFDIYEFNIWESWLIIVVIFFLFIK